jgi:hypothetical protein
MNARLRRVIVAVLVVVACVAAPIAMVAIWANRNLFDSDRFTTRLAPAIDEPAVQEAVSIYLTDQVLELVDVESFFEDAFDDRPRAQVLAGPLSTAVKGFVAQGVDEVVASDQFATLWKAAVEGAHRLAMGVLEDKGEIVSTSDGVVSLDLEPVVEAVLARLAEVAPRLVTVGSNIPALQDLGEIVLFEDEDLGTAQQALRRFEQFVWVAAAITVLAAGWALWLSKNRRRTGMQLAVGLLVGDVLVRRAGIRLVDDIQERANESGNPGAAAVVLERFLDPLLTFTAIAIVLLLIAVVVLAILGPYSWAAPARARIRTGLGWLGEHRPVVGAAAGAIGLVALWTLDLGWLAMFLVAAAVGAAIVWSMRGTEPETPSETTPATTPTT